jgi:hypothetical protein
MTKSNIYYDSECNAYYTQFDIEQLFANMVEPYLDEPMTFDEWLVDALRVSFSVLTDDETVELLNRATIQY